MSSDKQSAAWMQTCQVAALLKADPALPGVILRARAGPVREAALKLLPKPNARIHPAVSEDALLGGVDVAATLSAGRVIRSTGLLQPNTCVVVAMAERLPAHLAGQLSQALDTMPGLRLILLDEGASSDEQVPSPLADRLPYLIDLNEVGHAQICSSTDVTVSTKVAKSSQDDLAAIAQTTLALGINSSRAPLFAMQTACLLAENTVCQGDLEAACALTLAHRATRLPQPPEAADDTPPTPETEQHSNEHDGGESGELPTELLLEAILTSLPAEALARLSDQTVKGMRGSGSGAKQRGNRRGRPLPPRKGRKTSDQRFDLYATLRAAAPWQPMRRAQSGRTGLQIHSTDLHLKRFEDASDRLIIFAVDASGSAAISRLAEAKGAVEMLLSEAYARRDHVALISFRGAAAEILLPPTRSLVQTKRRLAELPGGGGTPLASGMEAALEMALTAQRRGMQPKVCFLTDGRANIDRSGALNRPQAMADAEALALQFAARGIEALVVDTGSRPERKLKDLANTLRAPYVPMPRADAHRISKVISDTTAV